METVSEAAWTWPESGADLRVVIVSKHAAERWAERRMRGELLDRLASAGLRRVHAGGLSAFYTHGKAQFRVSRTKRGCIVLTVCDEIEGRRSKNRRIAVAIRIEETKKKPKKYRFHPELIGR